MYIKLHKNGVWYQKTTDLSQNHYDDIINVVSCFLCDSANGRTWEMFLLKKTQQHNVSNNKTTSFTCHGREKESLY
jgi:hypothetical protein